MTIFKKKKEKQLAGKNQAGKNSKKNKNKQRINTDFKSGWILL